MISFVTLLFAAPAPYIGTPEPYVASPEPVGYQAAYQPSYVANANYQNTPDYVAPNYQQQQAVQNYNSNY